MSEQVTSIVVATTVKAVNPTDTELDRWASSTAVLSHIAFENTDGSQVYQGRLESRPVAGTGTWGRVDDTLWVDLQPGELRDFAVPQAALGAGELRFVATASGAGGNSNYTRRETLGAV